MPSHTQHACLRCVHSSEQRVLDGTIPLGHGQVAVHVGIPRRGILKTCVIRPESLVESQFALRSLRLLDQCAVASSKAINRALIAIVFPKHYLLNINSVPEATK